MTMRWTPLPTRVIPDSEVAEQSRREHQRAIEEMRREIEALRARVYALENP